MSVYYKDSLLDQVTASSGDERYCCIRVTAACETKTVKFREKNILQFIYSSDRISSFPPFFPALSNIPRKGHATEFIAEKSAVVRKLTCLVYARRQYNIQASCNRHVLS